MATTTATPSGAATAPANLTAALTVLQECIATAESEVQQA
jgi:hypothetical protein